jgi:hypothetical protein
LNGSARYVGRAKQNPLADCPKRVFVLLENAFSKLIPGVIVP